MSFEQRGFLSPDLDRWREHARKRFPQRFSLLDDSSDLAQRCLYEMCRIPRPDDNATKSLLTCALYARLLQLFQGSVVMLERGMVTNSRTLLRSGFETLFFVGASIMKEDFFTIAMQDHKFQQDKMLRAQIKRLRESDPPETQIVASLEAALTKVMDDMKNLEMKEAGFWNVAQMAGMLDAYDAYYRGLSTDSAHVNMFSILEIFNPEGGILVGPGIGQYEDSLGVAIALGITIAEAANMLIRSEEIEIACQGLIERAETVVHVVPLPQPH